MTPRTLGSSIALADRIGDIVVGHEPACGVEIARPATSVPMTDTTAIRSTVIDDNGAGSASGIGSVQSRFPPGVAQAR